jgi:hypothetical protein
VSHLSSKGKVETTDKNLILKTLFPKISQFNIFGEDFPLLHSY